MGWFQRRQAIKAIQGRTHPEAVNTTSLASLTIARPNAAVLPEYSQFSSTPWESPTTGVKRATTLLAAANVIDPRNYAAMPGVQPWQVDAWNNHDCLPELHAGTRWISNALSRVRLYVGIPDADGAGDPDPVDAETNDTTGADPRAREPLDELFNGPAGQSQMMARLGAHFTIPGESIICGWTDPDGQYRWHVASVEEVTINGGMIQLNLDGTGRPDTRITISRVPNARDGRPAEAQTGMALRLWRPHPRFYWMADSPLRALLGTCKTLNGAHAHIASSLESRLAGAGALFLPNSARIPGATPQPDSKPLHADPDMAALIDAMATPLRNPNSAAALVPLLVRMADDAIGKVQYMRFSSPLDERILEIREADQRRLAMGLDMPMEELLGKANLNHWASWQISEEAVKMFIAPLCEVICAALTERYLRPRLAALKIEDPERYVIAFDLGQLTQRPNRAPDAQTLFDKILLSEAATRRESGFGDDDAPDTEEYARRVIAEMALKGLPFENARPWLQALGVDLPDIPVTISTPPGQEADSTGEDPDSQDEPDGEGTPAEPGPPSTPGSPDNPTAPGPRTPSTPSGPAAVAASATTAELVPFLPTLTDATAIGQDLAAVAGSDGHHRA